MEKTVPRRRGRPAMKAEERKIQVTLRLPRDVVDFFRSDGPGWQSRISEVLAQYAKRMTDK